MHAALSTRCPAGRRWPACKGILPVYSGQRRVVPASAAGCSRQQNALDGNASKQSVQRMVDWSLIAHRREQKLSWVIKQWQNDRKNLEAEIQVLELSSRLQQESMEDKLQDVTVDLLRALGLLHMRGMIEYAEGTFLRDFPNRMPCTREAAWVKILEQQDALLSDMRGAVDKRATIPDFSRKIAELHAHLSKPEYKETVTYQAHWSGADIPTKMVTPEQEQLLLCIGKATYVRCYTGPVPIWGWQPGGVKPDIYRTSSRSNADSSKPCR